jgi:hypothetical protein
MEYGAWPNNGHPFTFPFSLLPVISGVFIQCFVQCRDGGRGTTWPVPTCMLGACCFEYLRAIPTCMLGACCFEYLHAILPGLCPHACLVLVTLSTCMLYYLVCAPMHAYGALSTCTYWGLGREQACLESAHLGRSTLKLKSFQHTRCSIEASECNEENLVAVCVYKLTCAYIPVCVCTSALPLTFIARHF